MRKISEVLRLQAAGLSVRDIAASTGIHRSTVHEYLTRAGSAGLSWPLPPELDEATVEGEAFRHYPGGGGGTAGTGVAGGAARAEAGSPRHPAAALARVAGQVTPTAGRTASSAATITSGWSGRTW